MNKLDELIKKLCPDGVEYTEINNICKVITSKIKIKSHDYLKQGLFPVIDQGKKFIGGYTNNTNVFPKDKYILFGDHTCIVKYVDFAFAQGADGVKILKANKDIIIEKYLYYCMSNIHMESNYSRHWSEMKIKKIPLPPLEVQHEIVRMLDSFTEHTALLEKELELRKKQYAYYRDQLLSFTSKTTILEWRTLGEVCHISAGGDVPKENFSQNKTNVYSIPIISNGIGENAFYGYTNIIKISKPAVTIAARGTIGYTEYRDYPYYPIIRLLSVISKDTSLLNTKYLYYVLKKQHYNVPKTGIPQLTSPMIRDLKIPVPPLEEQERIVEILDRFDRLCNDLTNGLPAEIKARQTQYEYYRDRLLNFKELK